jgi:4-hydroxybenzoyl-CoA reductase subunit beta
MLRLPRFQLVNVKTVADAARALRDEDWSKLLAGGTDLFPNMKRRQQAPATLVSLACVPGLNAISNGSGLHIGAMTTLTTIAQDPIVRARYAALAEAAASVSTPQLRNMGTVGGNLCLDTRCNWYDQSEFWRAAEGHCMKTHADVVCRVATSSRTCLAVASADSVPALLALGATVRVVNADGERRLDLASMYRDDGIAYLTIGRDDVVTSIDLPDAAGWTSRYLKLRERGSFDFPIVGVAAAVRLDRGEVREARIALTAVGSRPFLVDAAAAAVIGTRLEEAVLTAAGEACQRAARPMDNTAGTIAARRRAVAVLTERALRHLRARP